jgi:hypothetical protein
MSTYQVLFDGKAADNSFYDVLAKLEVEENADLPDAISLQLPVAAEKGELTWVAEERIRPYASLAVVVTPDEGEQQCIFDGHVLSHTVHVPAGPASATVDVWGQDASVLMGLEEITKEWSGLTDAVIAEQIFDKYGTTPSPLNSQDDSPSHTEEGHTVMQRGSDRDFLRRLARRGGRWFRVAGGSAAGEPVGWFALPDLTGDPITTIVLNDPATSSVPSLDFTWDVTRPTAVTARQASLTGTEQEGTGADTSDSGLAVLDARTLADFSGKDSSVILTAASDSDELPGRARAVLRDAGWFARCEGTADLAVLRTVLRVGDLVSVDGCGSLLSGTYLVWSVRHSITTQNHTMAFVLVRNAVGPAPAGAGSGPLGGLL